MKNNLQSTRNLSARDPTQWSTVSISIFPSFSRLSFSFSNQSAAIDTAHVLHVIRQRIRRSRAIAALSALPTWTPTFLVIFFLHELFITFSQNIRLILQCPSWNFTFLFIISKKGQSMALTIFERASISRNVPSSFWR